MEMPQKSIRQQRIYQPAHQLYKCVCQALSHCTFCNPSPQFPLQSAAMTGCSKASRFFPSMIPIALIEAITSPCKPCLHGILRPSWPKHRCGSPLSHIGLVSPLHHPLVLQEGSNRPRPQTCRPAGCRLVPGAIPCRIALLSSPGQESDVTFSQQRTQESAPNPAVSDLPSAPPPSPRISPGLCSHSPTGKCCSFYTKDTHVQQHFFGFALFFNLIPAKNVLLDMRSKVQLLTQMSHCNQMQRLLPVLTVRVCFIFF